MSFPPDVKAPKVSAKQTELLEVGDAKTEHIETTEPVAPTPTEPPLSLRRNDLIRFYKLQAIAPFKFWRSRAEHRKVAIHWSHCVAAGHALLHLFPLCAAIALLVLNLGQFFVGPSFHASTALQFLAKLHELFMQTSIAEIVLCIVRTQILQGYMPLGALSATTQTSHISYLWSLDFFATLTAPTFRGWRKWLFVIAVPLLIVLTALVGPSGATLMIPRPGSSGREAIVLWNSPYAPDSSFPSNLNQKQNMTFDIEDFQRTYSLLHENNTEYTNTQAYTNRKDDNSRRPVLRMLRYKPIFSEQFVVTATIPTLFSAQLLDEMVIDVASNESAAIKLPRPVVSVNCGYSLTPTATSPITYVSNDGKSRATIPSLVDIMQQYIDGGGSPDTRVDSLPPLWSNLTEPETYSYVFHFVDDTCAGAPSWSSPQISNLTNNSTWTSGKCFRVLTCSLNAYWEPSEHQVVGNDDGFRLVRTNSLSRAEDGALQAKRAISVDWDSVAHLKTPEFSAMIRESSENRSCILFAVSIATIISEIPWQVGVTSDNMPWQYVVTKITHGYGYGTSTVAIRLSLLVITAYCIVAVSYVTYILASGHTSTAWNSATELIVLALQSKRPEHLVNTSAGINSRRTYQEPVGIRANSSNRMELVFPHDSKTALRKLRRVMPNKPY